MFKYGIQCALEDLPERMPAVFRGSIHEVASAARKAGYDAIELYTHEPRSKNVAELKAAAADNNLTYCGIATGLEKLFHGLCLTADEPKARQAAVDRLKEHLDLGVAIGSPVVVGTMRGNLPHAAALPEYLKRLGEAFRQLDDYAQEIGGELLLENVTQYITNYLCTAAEVGDFIRDLNLPTLKLHLDTHSMHIEETQPYEMVREYRDVLGYIHFSDNNRGYPGAGVIDFKAYYHALCDIGYKSVITVESQPYPTAEACAVRGLTYLKHLEQAVRVERLSFKT